MLAVALMVSVLALPAPCTHAQLRMHVGRADGTAGTIYHPLAFTNAGGRACTLRGYPGVASVGGPHGHQVGAAAARDPFAIARVRLRAHGGAATALYGQVDTGVYDRARCRPVHALGLRVYAPGQTIAFHAALRHSACSAHLRDSHVRPVVAGRTGLALTTVWDAAELMRDRRRYPGLIPPGSQHARRGRCLTGRSRRAARSFGMVQECIVVYATAVNDNAGGHRA